MILQFVEGKFCLEKCRCCCRFSQQDSVWSPCLLGEEIAQLSENNIPAAVINQNKKIRLLPFPAESNPDLPAHIGPIFICPFLKPEDNSCKIYPLRPFECQLYPFLINRREKKIFLAVDLGCPYTKEKLSSQEFKEYVEYLADFLSLPVQASRLRNNPQIVQLYDDAMDLVELKF